MRRPQDISTGKNNKNNNKNKPSSKGKQKQNNNNQQVSQKKASQPNVKRTGMSPCAAEYCLCLANPFTGPAACIPSYPALLTRKTRAYAKGTFSTGTAGFGCITVTPTLGVANDQRFVLYTSSAFAGTSPTFNSTFVQGTAGNNYATSNSDYASGVFTQADSPNKLRVVSCGLRIRYAGTELNRGGYIVGFMDPNHESIMVDNAGAGKAQSTIEGYTESKRFGVDRKWKTVLFRPVDEIDNTFVTGDPTFLGAGGTVVSTPGMYYMAFYVQAASSATPLTYEWEVYANYEVTGRGVRGKTASHFDPVGHAAVHASTVTTTTLLPSEKSDSERMAEFVKHTESYLDTAMSIGGGLAHLAQRFGPAFGGAMSLMAEIL